MAFLHEIFNNSFVCRALSEIAIPAYISDNIKFEIRPYQKEQASEILVSRKLHTFNA